MKRNHSLLAYTRDSDTQVSELGPSGPSCFTRRFVYVLPCVILFLRFSVLLALWLPRFGKRELILVLFVRLFDLCLFGFVCFLYPWCLGRAAVCNCGTSWTFLLPFSPELKSKLTWDLVGSSGWLYGQNSKIYSDRKSKMAAIVAILKIYFRFLFWTERPVDLNLTRKHRGDM